MSDQPVKTINIGSPSVAPTSESLGSPSVDETPIDDTMVSQEEADVTEAIEKPAEEPKMAARFAALARQEEKNRADRLEMKETQERIEDYNKLRDAVKVDPMAALEHLGIDLDSLIMASLGDAAPEENIDPVSKLQQEFESYKEQQIREREEAESAQTKARQDAMDEAVEAHRQNIDAELRDNSSKYELIQLNDAQDLVWEVTEAHFNENGEVLTPSQAADLVEAHLDEQFEKIAKARKVSEPIQENMAPIEEKRIINSKTLTSSMTANTPQVQVEHKTLSAEESKRRAASMLRWND